MLVRRCFSQIKSVFFTHRFFPPDKCCHGRDRNNICQEDLSMEILEAEERRMNKNKERTYTFFRTLLFVRLLS
ncbi:MAG: hypothetical protein D8B57_03255 [Prevotella sp.]|nr:MAG: hypothetical protein D8B57_03255 [Prevotella sp.]